MGPAATPRACRTQEQLLPEPSNSVKRQMISEHQSEEKSIQPGALGKPDFANVEVISPLRDTLPCCSFTPSYLSTLGLASSSDHSSPGNGCREAPYGTRRHPRAFCAPHPCFRGPFMPSPSTTSCLLHPVRGLFLPLEPQGGTVCMTAASSASDRPRHTMGTQCRRQEDVRSF